MGRKKRLRKGVVSLEKTIEKHKRKVAEYQGKNWVQMFLNHYIGTCYAASLRLRGLRSIDGGCSDSDVSSSNRV